MATILEGLNQISEKLGGTAEAENNLEALNAISAALGGSADAETNADAIANIAENASGGGGGSSDLSTATVTIIDPDECLEHFYGPCIENNEARTYFNGDPSEGIPVILYNGTAEVGVSVSNADITLSGDVTSQGGAYIVTGNCTFTITAI